MLHVLQNNINISGNGDDCSNNNYHHNAIDQADIDENDTEVDEPGEADADTCLLLLSNTV